MLEPFSCADRITEAQRYFRSKALEPGMAGIECDRFIKPRLYGRKIFARKMPVELLFDEPHSCFSVERKEG